MQSTPLTTNRAGKEPLQSAADRSLSEAPASNDAERDAAWLTPFDLVLTMLVFVALLTTILMAVMQSLTP